MSKTQEMNENEVDLLQRYLDLKADHVSKAELRAWCYMRIAEWLPIIGHPAYANKPEGVINEMNLILEKFCKGEK